MSSADKNDPIPFTLAEAKKVIDLPIVDRFMRRPFVIDATHYDIPCGATFARDHLRAFVERIERLDEEKKALADDIKEVYAEAKGTGFDVKALRTVIRLRKQDVDERKESEAILETYMHALGMLS